MAGGIFFLRPRTRRLGKKGDPSGQSELGKKGDRLGTPAFVHKFMPSDANLSNLLVLRNA